MSRLEDTMRRDLEQIAGRATPSPDAWAQIQSRIADQEPIQETEIIMLTENTLTRRRWPLVAAAAAAVVALVIAIAAVNRDTEPEIPADNPAPTVPTGRDGETAVDGDESTAEAEPEDSTTSFSNLDLGDPIPAGSYQLDRLGIPVSFEVSEPNDEPWTLLLDDAIAISIGTDTGFVAFTRVGSFFDADQAIDPQTTGLGNIPPNDVDEWIEATGAEVVDSAEVEIDGRAASYRRIGAPEGAGVDSGLCPSEAVGCLLLSSPSADLIDEFPNSPSRIGMTPASFWFVELDDFEPLGIWVSAPPTNEGWLDQVQPLIDSITLGDPGPAIDGGTARLPAEFTTTGTFTGIRPPGEPNADGSLAVTNAITMSGDITGEILGVGTSTVEQAGVTEQGTEEYTFTGTIDGAGSGTVTYTLEWQLVGGTFSSIGVITGGTDDFEGAAGTVATSIREVGQEGESSTSAGTITFLLRLPNPG